MENELILQSDAQTPENLRIMQELLSKSSQKSGYLRSIPTPKNVVKQRKAGEGKSYDYVDRIVVLKWLDEHYPCWSYEVLPESFLEFRGWIQLMGKLTVIDPDTGLKRVITCYGEDEIEQYSKGEHKGEDINTNFAKNADTDALKRCVFSLGGFTDVYTDEKLEGKSLQEGDWVWFNDTILPMLWERHKNGTITAKQMHSQIKMFGVGMITKQDLIRSYKIVEVK